MRNEKLDLLVTFDKNYIEPFKVMLGLSLIHISPDIAISMGCDVGCPYIGRYFDDNWGLPDPTGQSDEVFKEVIKQIEEKIMLL